MTNQYQVAPVARSLFTKLYTPVFLQENFQNQSSVLGFRKEIDFWLKSAWFFYSLKMKIWKNDQSI